MELRLTARRGENLLVTLVVPVALLVFFVAYPIGVPAGVRTVDAVIPGILAVAIIAAGLVNLGIATGYERSYGVLKRLGATPLSRSVLVLAKIAGVVLLELVQVIVLAVVAAALLGWRPPHLDIGTVAAALVLGTAAFAGLGLLLAGTLRAETTLALANALFLGFVLVGGVVVAPGQLPDALAALARALPGAALADALRAGLGGPADPGLGTGSALVVLAGWAVATVALAARRFRWD
jgi:ABC-2 type transport system permease protein